MGSLHAQEFAALVGEGTIGLEAALSWHLGHNHYPPIPDSFIPAAVAAIAAANEGEWDREIELPEGITYRGESTAPASAIIEQHHLDAFLHNEEDDFDYDGPDWPGDEEEDEDWEEPESDGAIGDEDDEGEDDVAGWEDED